MRQLDQFSHIIKRDKFVKMMKYIYLFFSILFTIT